MADKLNIDEMVRENIRKLVPYSSAREATRADPSAGAESREPSLVFLDANENPYNAPWNRYPDPRQTGLKALIAGARGQEPGSLFLGNGSDEGIDVLFRVLCNPGVDNVLIVEPTYGMYGVCAQVNGIRQKSVLLDSGFRLDAHKVCSAVDRNTKMIFLCSPNNPTSNSYDRETMLEVIRKVPCMVVVDEAYIDFSAGEGLLSLVPETRNLVVLQTLSKAWGLAGIRLGMVFAHPDLIGYMTKVKYPYNVNSLTLEKAREALRDPQKKADWVEEILHERNRLAKVLGSFRCIKKVFPSDANFLLVRADRPREIRDFLTGRGLIVRDRSHVPLCEGCLRITVGTPEENNRLLESLSAYDQTHPISRP